MASTIPATKTALLTLLDGLAVTGQPLDGVKVARVAEAGKHTDYREYVWVENAIEIEREHRLGATFTQENFVIPVRVEVVQHGDDFEACETRMWAVLAAVEKAVMESDNLGGLVSQCAPFGIPEGETSTPVDDRQIFAAATVRIECIAMTQLAA